MEHKIDKLSELINFGKLLFTKNHIEMKKHNLIFDRFIEFFVISNKFEVFCGKQDLVYIIDFPDYIINKKSEPQEFFYCSFWGSYTYMQNNMCLVNKLTIKFKPLTKSFKKNIELIAHNYGDKLDCKLQRNKFKMKTLDDTVLICLEFAGGTRKMSILKMDL